MRLQSGLGMQSFEGLTGAGRSFQNGSLTWQLGGGFSPLMAVGRRAQFLAMWAPSWGCYSVLIIWQLPSSRVNDPRESNKAITPFMT